MSGKVTFLQGHTHHPHLSSKWEGWGRTRGVKPLSSGGTGFSLGL
jgi:hypothetical protein